MLLEVQPPEDAARFLCESSVNCTVEAVLRHVVMIHELRTQLAARTNAARTNATSATKRKRTCDDTFESVSEACESASALLSAQSVRRKLVMTPAELRHALKQCGNVEDAVETLHEWDAGLFFAGKWLEVDRPISAYVGGNEKTKVSVSLRLSDVPPSALCHVECPVLPPVTDEGTLRPAMWGLCCAAMQRYSILLCLRRATCGPFMPSGLSPYTAVAHAHSRSDPHVAHNLRDRESCRLIR